MSLKQLSFLALAILVLSGCGSSDPVPVTEIGEIEGYWRTDPPGSALKIRSGGTILQGLTVGKINEGEYTELVVVFEDGLTIISGNTTHTVCETTGSYRLQILSSGNLEFGVVDDECSDRIEHFLNQETVKEYIRVEGSARFP